jgi:hypothetical protein
MAIEVEFWNERDNVAITMTSAEVGAIPTTGDWCVVPEGDGMFATVEVRSRHLYFDAGGTLRRVRLSCKVSKRND